MTIPSFAMFFATCKYCLIPTITDTALSLFWSIYYYRTRLTLKNSVSWVDSCETLTLRIDVRSMEIVAMTLFDVFLTETVQKRFLFFVVNFCVCVCLRRQFVCVRMCVHVRADAPFSLSSFYRN